MIRLILEKTCQELTTVWNYPNIPAIPGQASIKNTVSYMLSWIYIYADRILILYNTELVVI